MCHKSAVKKKPYFLFMAGLLCLLFPLRLQASGGAAFLLNSLRIIYSEGWSHLEASLSVSDPDQLQASLLDGAALNLEATILLKQPRILLPGRTIHEQHLLFQMRFDPLTREYLLLQHSAPPIRRRSLEHLLEDVLGDASIPLVPMTMLSPGGAYQVNLTLGIRYAEVPPWLEKALFFWSWDIISPATFHLEFIYNGGADAILPCPETSHV